MSPSLAPLPLPAGVESSYVDCTSSCGLVFHCLSAGRTDDHKKPLILLTHGFPELAFSWRKIIPQLASQGYYVVAPDQRGYGRTTGWDRSPFDKINLAEFTITNLVRDLVCLVYALGYKQAHCIIGHDFGAVASAQAPLIRPDVFLSSVQMSHPHHAPPEPPFNIHQHAEHPPVDQPGTPRTIQDDLAELSPPRKHYKWYNSTEQGTKDWDTPGQGLHDFLRGYFHLKSADWPKNDPKPLDKWTAEALASMPEYYVLQKNKSMPETVEKNMKGEDVSATKRWLSDDDLAVYVSEWSRTGFLAALTWYRAQTSSSPTQRRDMLLYAGRKITVPTVFISGEKDWGTYQQPGAFDKYSDNCTDYRGATIVPNAGHWVQQEQPEAVMKALTAFLQGVKQT